MKIFDSEEQIIIKKITQGSGFSRNLINIIDSHKNLSGTRIIIDIQNRTVDFLFEIKSDEPTEVELQAGFKKQAQITESLIKHLILLRYIDNNELAIFFEPAKNNDKFIGFGSGAINRPSFTMELVDQNIVELLIKYIRKEIIPSPSLKQLEQNNFLSEEEIRFQKQLAEEEIRFKKQLADNEVKFNKQNKATWFAIFVSVVLGLYGMYINYTNNVSQEKQFNAQQKEYLKAANQIATQIDKSIIDYRPTIEMTVNKLANKMCDS